jgi:putative sterol carrier protein
MVDQRKKIHIKSTIVGVYATLMITGLGLLILALILLLKMYEAEPINPQNQYVFMIFLIAFAVLGFGLIIIGTFIALISPSRSRKMSSSILDKIHIEEDSADISRKGLQIIRPRKSVKTAISSTEDVTKEIIPQKTEVVKRIEETSKSLPAVKTKKVEPKEKDIPSDFNYEDGLQSIVDRYNTEKVKKAFKGWYNTMMMTFPDISKSFLFNIKGDEGIDLSEGVDESAAVQVKMDSAIFIKMMTKQINPIKAYSSGNLEVKGEMKNMLKLRKLMF